MGVKSFLLCDSETGYIVNAEIYTGKSEAIDINSDLGAAGNVVWRLLRDAGADNKHHILFVDCFYTSCMVFFYNFMKTHAVGTCMTNRKGFPPSLVVKKTNWQEVTLCI